MSNKLWEASLSIKKKSNLFKFEKFLSKKFNYKINKNYNKLFKWSINNLNLFWSSVWEYANVKGKKIDQRKKILDDAKQISRSGVFALILECVVENLAKEITKKVTVPTIGIGASRYCDGQILVIDDMLGMSDFYPKFVKKYSNLKETIEKSIRNYTKDVKLKRFPYRKNVYK